MNYDVFISYSRKDTKIADRICAAFDKAGITYFIDRHGIYGGMEFPEVLAEAILGCRKFLFLASANSYCSQYTKKELTFASNKKDKNSILPYRIDRSKIPNDLEFMLCTINWRNIVEHPIETVLVNDILQMLGQPVSSSTAVYASNNVSKLANPYKAIFIAVAVVAVAAVGVLLSKNSLINLLPSPDTPAIRQNGRVEDIMAQNISNAPAAQHSDTQSERVGGQPKQAAPAAASATTAGGTTASNTTVSNTAAGNQTKVSANDAWTAADRSVSGSSANGAGGSESAQRKQQSASDDATSAPAAAATTATTATTAAANPASAASAAEERPAVKTYKVGDYYNENGKTGVVFEVDATGRHGKIVGMRQEQGRRLQWCTADEFEARTVTGASSRTDGMRNMQAVMRIADWREKYPAFAWCAAQGDGWYLPAIEEVRIFIPDANRDKSTFRAVNRTLAKYGGVALGDDIYWTSTEATGGYTEYAWAGGYSDNRYTKDTYGFYTRAVAAF